MELESKKCPSRSRTDILVHAGVELAEQRVTECSWNFKLKCVLRRTSGMSGVDIGLTWKKQRFGELVTLWLATFLTFVMKVTWQSNLKEGFL